jgi:predicted esterase
VDGYLVPGTLSKKMQHSFARSRLRFATVALTAILSISLPSDRSVALAAAELPNAKAEAPSLPPLPAGAGFSRLDVAGFLSAVVAWPKSGPEAVPAKLPVLVATHGSYDQPEWNCETYKNVVAGRAIVVCPRGKIRWDTPTEPTQLRYFFPSTAGWLLREAEAAIASLRAAHPSQVDPGPAIYAGFSQGAIMGVPLLVNRGKQFPRLILVEGGHGGWSPQTAAAYKKSGGERVLFACGRASCKKSAAVAAGHLQKAGVLTQVVGVDDEGHTYSGRVEAALIAAFPWLVEGDARFSSP